MTDVTADPTLRRWLTAAVLVHAVVATWHGAAHMNVPVPLTTLQVAFVGVVITLAPLVGMAMLWTSHRRAGAIVIALSMGASLVFGVVNHFVLHSPDNVMEVPDHAWRHSFVLSAALVAVTEAAGAVLGAVVAKAWSRGA